VYFFSPMVYKSTARKSSRQGARHVGPDTCRVSGWCYTTWHLFVDGSIKAALSRTTLVLGGVATLQGRYWAVNTVYAKRQERQGDV
jgi:hypothetical protein